MVGALPEEVKAAQAKGTPLNVPTGLGAITVSYNVSGLKTGLKLDGPTIANIFLGTVKKWNDPAIAALNPGVKLPSTSITVVHRSDSSGTTKGFTGFLASASPTWKRRSFHLRASRHRGRVALQRRARRLNGPGFSPRYGLWISPGRRRTRSVVGSS